MEIRVEQHLTGREMRESILHRHESRAALEQAVEGGDTEAQDDLAILRLLDERPERLDEVFDVAEVTRLAPEELAKLSRTSFRILEFLVADPYATAKDVARALGLSRGACQHHLRLLAPLGLAQVRPTPRSREKVRFAAMPGLDIHITTPKSVVRADN